MNDSYGKIIQTIGVVAVVVAIEIEIYTQQDVWMILATTGSLIFAIGTKIVYFGKIKKRRKVGWNDE